MTASSQVALVHLPVLVRFALVMAICWLIPPLCRRLRIPSAVGLLAAGIVVGPHGLYLFPQDGPVAGFLAEVGKLLLMFFAGLEIDLSQFRRTGKRSLGFGMMTFAIPQAIGTTVGLLAGYGWLGGLLIGSLMASHTLLGFPIVQRMNLVTNEAVAVAVGGTVLTDLMSLLVLAVCVPIFTSGFSGAAFAGQIVELLVYIVVLLVGLGFLSRWRWLIDRMMESKEAQVSVLFVVIVLAGLGAEAINLEGIVGAFLAGLAVNRALTETDAKKEFEFIGNTIFIPIFFVSIGFLIDVRLFMQTIVGKPELVLGIVGGLILAKFLAARLTERLYGYSHAQGSMIWSLSLPQVAATLASAIVAYGTKNAAGARLIDESMINTVLVLVVVTSILGPILTERYGRQLLRPPGSVDGAAPS